MTTPIAAESYQARTRCPRIGDILTGHGTCTQSDIESALEIQETYGGKIGTILLNMGAITEDQLLKALGEQLGIEYKKNLDDKDLVQVPLPADILRENRVYPCSINDTELEILTNNPLNTAMFSLLEHVTGRHVKVTLAREDLLKTLDMQLETETLSSDSHLVIDIDAEVERLKELASEAPVIKLVNSILSKAVEGGSSDIHFEALRGIMKIRFRIDGVLHLVDSVPERLKLAVIARLKLICGMNIAENRLPQDGRTSVRIAGHELDIRASSVPTRFGESFVLRLLGKETIEYSLEKLGFYADQIETIREITNAPNGIFLTTGPTGSGKTTTLYSMLSELSSDAVKIITVEDPVEYEFPGISQINVRPDIDYTFANALRSILRQDPDTIMVGEIRDLETGRLAVQAALTGHLVLSTLHTNSALGAITRLIDMGIEYFLVKACLVGVMAQRLVRSLCPACRTPAPVSPQIAELYHMEDLVRRYPFMTPAPAVSDGCEQCNHTGYRGRIAIAEVLATTSALLADFDPAGNRREITDFGSRSIAEDGLLKYYEGRTSLDEILRRTG